MNENHLGLTMETAVNDVEEYIGQLKASIEALSQENTELWEQIRGEKVPKIFYTFDEFLTQLYARRSKMYAWKTAYLEASKEDTCVSVSVHMIKQWQNEGHVPSWAVDQINRMTFPPIIRPSGMDNPRKWTEREKNILITFHLEDPYRTNLKLAELCSNRFDRYVNENGIRGMLNRIRKLGQVPPRRPRKIEYLKNYVDRQVSLRHNDAADSVDPGYFPANWRG